jgi:hypothetical protein
MTFLGAEIFPPPAEETIGKPCICVSAADKIEFPTGRGKCFPKYCLKILSGPIYCRFILSGILFAVAYWEEEA